MAYSFEKRLLLGKIETSEGVDAAPTGSANALITVGLDAASLESETRERNTDGLYFGNRPSVNAQIRRPVRFNVEIAGSGDADAKPAWMPFLRPAGFDAGTVIADTSVTQLLISTGIASMTLWPFYDNLKLASLGARANLTMTFEDDQIPLFGLEYMGFPTAGVLAAEATVTPTFANQVAPVLCSTENTTFSLDGFAFPLRRLTINLNNAIEPRSLIGPADKAMFRNRAPTFEAVVELPDLDTHNMFTKTLSRATAAMQVVHGVTAGNIVTVASPYAEYGMPTFSEENGIVMATLPGRLLPSASSGNDELSIVAT